MLRKLLQLGEQILGLKKNEQHQSVKNLYALIEKKALFEAPLSSKERIRSLLQKKHAEMRNKYTEKALINENNIFINTMNTFFKKGLRYGLAAIIILAVAVFGTYQFVPAPKVSGYAVKNALKETPYNGGLKIVFTQPMNRDSVEKAFKIEPAITGKFEWSYNTLKFIPSSALKVGDKYEVSISIEAKSLLGKNLDREYAETFLIIEAPKVIFFTPAGTESVLKEAKITVMFNQPMNTLTTIDESEKEAPKMLITPSMPGKFKWLGTSSLQFIPENLPLSTKFEVTLPKGFEGTNGRVLDEEKKFSFETVTPEVISPVYAADPYNYSGSVLGPKDKMYLLFNQRVTLDSAKDAITIISNGNNLPFNLNYLSRQEYAEIKGLEKDSKETADEKIDRENMLAISSTLGWPLASSFTLEMKPGVKSVEGPLPSKKNFSTAYSSIYPLKITELVQERNYTRMVFNNSVDSKDLARYLSVKPENKDAKLVLDFGNEQNSPYHYIEYGFEPGNEYTYKVAKGLKDKYGQELADDFEEKRKSADAEPILELLINSPNVVLDANLPPELYVKSINVNEALLTLTDNDQMRIEKTLKIENKKNKFIHNKINLNEFFGVNLKPGNYNLFLNTKEKLLNYNYYNNYANILITGTSLAYKYADNKILIWATSLDTGLPKKDMEISVPGYPKLKTITDKDGLAELVINKDDFTDYYSNLVIEARSSDDFSKISTNWSEGIDSWNYGISSTLFPQQKFIYVYTERPIYKPGDLVYFKGIIRLDNGLGMNLPEANKIATLTITDSSYKEILKKDYTINRNGTINGEFKLDKTAPLGDYQVSLTYEKPQNDNYYYNSSGYSSFYVANFRKPEYKVSINSKEESYLNRQAWDIDVSGEYFFGGALKNAPLYLSLYKQNYYFNEYQEDWYNFSTDDFTCYFECPNSGNELVKSVSTTLDQNGKYKFTYTPEINKDSLSQIYTLEVSVIDPNTQQSISNRTNVVVHKGEYYVGIKPTNYVFTKNEDIVAKVISVDKSGKVVPNKKVAVKLLKRTWNSVKKQNVDGHYYYQNNFEDKLIDQISVQTGSDGKAEAAFKNSGKLGGSFVITAESTDSQGNLLTSSSWVYLTTDDYISWGRDNNDRIELVTDKLDYKTGETARVLIKSPYANVKALLTIEKNSVLEKKIIDIKSNSQIVEIPIKDEYLPNAYVSVLISKGGFSKQSIAFQTKNLETAISSFTTKSQAIEGKINENMKTITNLDELQKANDPFKAEFAALKTENEKNLAKLKELKAAEEKLAQTSSNEDGLASFKLGYVTLNVNTAEKNLAIDLKTNKERYLPGEEVIVDIETKNAKDKPVSAEISLSVVDESLLSLKESLINDLVSFFFMKRSLGVTTAHNLTKYLNRINVMVEAGLKGGGGGGAQEKALLSTKKRADFKDTAFWQANIETNAEGKAQIKFTLPDNLTSWEMLAVGITKNTEVGTKKKSFLVNKDVLLRPVVPRFMIINDELEIGLISHNAVSEQMNADVSIEAEGIEISGEKTKSVVLNKGKEEKTMWKVKVNYADKAKIIFKVEDKTNKNLRDEVEFTLPIFPYTYPEVVASAGVIGKDQNSVTEGVFIPANIDKNLGQLKISVSATFMGAIAKGLEYLVGYPYGCAEQTASSLLPNLAVKRILDLPNISNDAISLKNLDDYVNSGIQRLYTFQQANGGFGIWQDSEATIYLTSYVLYTLDTAKKAGYFVDENVLQNAKKYILDNLSNFYNESDRNGKAYALFVLSELGSPQVSMLNNLYDNRDKLNFSGKAYLALAMSRNTELNEKAKTLTDFLLSHQKVTERGVHFEMDSFNYGIFDNNAKLNALMLQLTSRIYPENPIIDKMLREIRYQRQQTRYPDTHSTSMTLLALAEYLTNSKEFESEFTAKVRVNGEDKLESAFFKKENFGIIKDLLMDMTNLLKENQENEVVLSKNGSGKMYYDMEFKYYLKDEAIKARENGFSIEQNYYNLADEKEEVPLTTLPYGQTIKGKIKVVVPEDRYYVVVEDMLPAALEAVDFNLNTSMMSLDKERYSYPWGNNLWHFNHQEIRDDRVAYFADFLPKGVYEISYFARVSSVGQFMDLPAKAEQMYMPEVFARTFSRKISSN